VRTMLRFPAAKNILVPHFEHRALFRAAVAPPPDDGEAFIEKIEVSLIKGAEGMPQREKQAAE